MSGVYRLPATRAVGFSAPFRWLRLGWGDLWASWPASLAYGLVMAVVCAGLGAALIASNMAYWAFALTCGFVFVAPVLAMGNYETGRRLEKGQKPTLVSAFIVPQAFRQDVAYLGLTLLVMFFMWGQIAQVVYGLSTSQIHRTIAALIHFATGVPEGRRMLVVGSLIGGVIAFLTYCLVVVSAPMLLDRRNSIFEATVTSVRAVNGAFAPMLLWAFIIATLTLGSAATGFAAFVIVFPWLGLASWRAYRDLVAEPN